MWMRASRTNHVPATAVLPQFRAYNSSVPDSRSSALGNGYRRRLFHAGMNVALTRRSPRIEPQTTQTRNSWDAA